MQVNTYLNISTEHAQKSSADMTHAILLTVGILIIRSLTHELLVSRFRSS